MGTPGFHVFFTRCWSVLKTPGFYYVFWCLCGYSNNKPPPFWDGLHHLFTVFSGLVYYCYTLIIFFAGFRVGTSVAFGVFSNAFGLSFLKTPGFSFFLMVVFLFCGGFLGGMVFNEF